MVVGKMTTKICIKEDKVDTSILTIINPLAEHRSVLSYKVCTEYVRTFLLYNNTDSSKFFQYYVIHLSLF